VLGVDQRAEFDVATHRYHVTQRGHAQGTITGNYLKERFGTFDIRYASYYTRSQETMADMYPGLKFYEDPRLAEAQRGIWHTMTHAQMQERFPEEVARKRKEGLYHYRPWGGENWPDVELRVHSFLGTLSRDYDDQDVVIVVHGHWLILFERLVEHFSIEEAMRRYEGHVVANASVTLFKDSHVNGKSRLVQADYVVPWEGKL
jgi:broad specificity phosphatase PhoE